MKVALLGSGAIALGLLSGFASAQTAVSDHGAEASSAEPGLQEIVETFPPPFSLFTVATLRPPRAYGLRLGVHF